MRLGRTAGAAVLVAALIMTPALIAPVRAADGPTVSASTLPNGLELIIIPDRRAPVVTHMIWYKAGAADEVQGTSGIAHFLEHLMFKGTAANPAGKFSEVVARIGGQENAFTSNDYTGYFQRVPSDKLRTVMEFEADRMTGLQLTDAVVLPERDVILEERNQRTDNVPRARLGEQMSAALYLNHPYGRPIIGWRHEMEKLSREDAIAWYKKYYEPNNAIVVIAGDVDTEATKKLVSEIYGRVAPGPQLPERVRPQEPPQIAARTVTLADPRVELPSVSRDYLVPSFSSAKRAGGDAVKESAALEVLAHILGTGSNSRLYRALVVDRALAVSAGAYYDSGALDPSKFGVYGSPRDGITLPQLEAGIDATIADLAEKGVTADEMTRSKTRLIADAVYAQDNQASMARWYGSALTSGATVADIQQWPDRIRAVTPDEVQAAARKWLMKERSVTGYLIKDTRPQTEKRS